jgi:hypothetical protein
VYSIVSAGVLALDLVRHPSGAQVADAVDRVLCLRRSDLRALAEARAAETGADHAAARQLLLEAARERPRPEPLLRGVTALVADLGDAGEAAVALEALSEALVGDLDGLLDLLRREAPLDDPDVPAAATEACLDAVAAAWVGAGAGPAALAVGQALRRAFDEALPPWAPPLPDDGYGPHAPDVRDVLDAVVRLDDDAWARVEAAHRAARGRRTWSEAMHVACRAAHEDDRLPAVARAQLAAARALRLSPVSTTPRASACAMSVVAAVQATAVLDLVEVETARELLRPWQAGTGAL